MTPNRLVALLTPVCALAAGWAATWLAKHVPGVNISADQLEPIFIAGAVAVLAPAAQWLYGWQKYEERAAQAEVVAGVADAAPIPEAFEELPEDELEDLPEDELGELPEDELEFDELDEIMPAEDEEPVTAG
jgi:hypothetical protein